MEAVLLEYQDRDFLGRAFILRTREEREKKQVVQQTAWGVALDPIGHPPIFPITHEATGWSKEGNTKVGDLAAGIGRAVDYTLSHGAAVSKAYALAREYAKAMSLVDRTSFSRESFTETKDPFYQLWCSTQ